MFHGKMHELNGDFSNSYVDKLPEGKYSSTMDPFFGHVCWENPIVKLVDVPSVFDTDFFRLGMDCQGLLLLGSEGSVR